MKLTLVRHSEVDELYKHKYNGHNNIGLSKNGDKQAKELCKKLNAINYDVVFCSDLKRAKDTVKYLNKSILYTNKLREKSWGKHEGLSFDEIISQNEIVYKDFKQWIKDLDGEDYEGYIKRVKKFFFEFLLSLKKENILIITHAGVIRVLLSLVNNISLEEAFSIKVDYGELIYADI